MGKLDGKKVLITGANSGIGAAIAIAMAAEGGDIAINYPNGSGHAGATETARRIAQMGRAVETIQADVSDPAAVQAMIETAISALGHIDILVNNAGITSAAPLHELPIGDWDRVMGVNLRGTFLTMRAVLPHMYHRGSGKIINNASQLAYKGAPGFAHYVASKGGIISLTRAAALEAAPRGVQINAVAPGATETPILNDVDPAVLAEIRAGIPRGKLAQASDIAPAFVFLASADADHFVGQTISPNGGDVFL